MTQRFESIDQFRGFAILMMVLANYYADIEMLPAWLKHAPDVGYTVIDLVAPLFIFAIGLTFGLSARKRLARDGRGATYAHFFRRAMALIGIGCVISVGASLVYYPDPVAWGVLQAIGASILLTLPTIHLSTSARLGIGLGLLGTYQFLLDRCWLETVLGSSHGGLPGSLGWGAMLILSTVLADLFHDQARDRRFYPLACLLTLALGIGLALLVPVSKNRVSASYVLISLGLSGLMHVIFHFLTTHTNFRPAVLSACGRNPLLLYLIHYLILGLIVLPGIPAWHAQAPLWLVFVQSIGLLAILSWASLYLDKRNWRFSL